MCCLTTGTKALTPATYLCQVFATAAESWSTQCPLLISWCKKIMYVQKTKIKYIQSEEFALHIKDPSYPINNLSWMIDTNIPIKYIRILNFDSAPGGLASGPSVLATSKKKKKEERKKKERINSFKICKRSESLHHTNKQKTVPQYRESQLTRAKSPTGSQHLSTSYTNCNYG